MPPTSPQRYPRIAFPAALVLFVLSSCEQFPPPAPAVPPPAAQVPLPAPAPAAPESALPVIAPPPPPAAPVEVSPPAEPPPPPGLNEETIAGIALGTPYDEVDRLLALPGTLVSRAGTATQVYRWTNAEGHSFMARFENGALVRKSALLVPGEASSTDAATAPMLLTALAYERMLPGTSLEEALAMFPAPPEPVVDNNADILIYKWLDSNGASFFARFENGKLARKTVLQPRPAPPLLPAVLLPPPEPQAIESAPPTSAQEDLSVDEALPEAEISEPVADETPPESLRRPNVIVASTARNRGLLPGDPAQESGSYRPKAELPEHAFTLRNGVYEVRISNPTDSAVTAGLRQGNRGRNLSIPAGGARSVHVDQGTYTVHYVFDNAPYTLHQGGSINIDGQFSTDTAISLGADGSSSQPLTYDPDHPYRPN